MNPGLWVNSIQRFCLQDGPGIRTTVFLQGCGLHCWWCHNPEARPTQSPSARLWRVDELAASLLGDARYWRSSGGGVTLSGGEPLLQSDGVVELLELLGDAGHHRAVETAGSVPLESILRVRRLVDLWLFDLKTVSPESYSQGTGGNADLSLGNLRWLVEATKAAVRVRIPVITGFNTMAAEVESMARWIESLPRPVEVELLPGHDLKRELRINSGGKPGSRRSAQPSQSELARMERTLVEHGVALKGVAW